MPLTRCWVRRADDAIHVVAWYLLADGSWLYLSRTSGLISQPHRDGQSVNLLKDLESREEWEEVPFASLQP